MDSLRSIVENRNSAVRELRSAPHKAGSEWYADRVREIEHANRWIERTAGRLGMSPAELIELSEMD